MIFVPAKPSAVFHASAVLASLVPSTEICAFAAWHAVLAAAFALHTFVSWSQMRFVMMFGFKASSWPLLTSGSWAWKVNSVSERPSSPASNFMVGVQRPKSRPAMVDGMSPGAAPAAPSRPAGTDPDVDAAAEADVAATATADEDATAAADEEATAAAEVSATTAVTVTVDATHGATCVAMVVGGSVAATETAEEAATAAAVEAATEAAPEAAPAAPLEVKLVNP